MGLGKSLNEEVVVVEDGEEVVGGGEFNKSFGGSTVSCSICLEVVADNGDRSWAKLQCSHQFHLDCIGSAFNIKGAMQCPNCRKIEKGKWLYANGCRSVPEFNMDDWAHEEDLDDLSYSEMSLGVGVGVHWCPLSSVARIHPSFEEGEFSSNAYHELFGQRAFLTEHTAAVASACPYVYMGPVHHPSNSSSSGSVSDGSSFNRHWSGPSIPSELPSSYAFPAMDVHYHSWEHHSPLFSTTSSRMAPADHPSIPSTRRSARNSSDLPRSGSFVHPFLLGHSFSDRASSSVASSISQPYQGSNARSRDRVQALQAYYQQQQPGSSPTSRAPMTPGARRSSSHRGMSQAGTMASSSDQSSFYFIPAGASGRSFQEAESTTHSRFRTRERDHPPSYPLNRTDRDAAWVAFHQNAGGSDPGTRSSSLRQWDGSERMPSSQNRS